MIVSFMACVLLLSAIVNTEFEQTGSSRKKKFNKTCASIIEGPCKNISLTNETVNYFNSRLIFHEPMFVHFHINLTSPSNETNETFRPSEWVWTYGSGNEKSPYLSWNIDYGLLSFGLLDAKTENIPNVFFNIPTDCQITYGTPSTTSAIACALTDLICDLSKEEYPKYENNNFCFLSEAPGIRETIDYQAALYLNFPISFINYNCCSAYYSYERSEFIQNCSKDQTKKIMVCSYGPYVLGIALFLYFPIVLLEICAWLAKDEKIVVNGYTQHSNDENWLFLDGKSPLTFLDLFSSNICGLQRSHPVLISRIRRFVVIMVAPVIIFIQLYMYSGSDGIGKSGIRVKDLVDHGTPVGFLSLLGNKENRNNVFVPYFGGASCLLIMYYITGILFLFCPRSLKLIVEIGMPQGRFGSKTPLCFSVEHIQELSMLNVISIEPGYDRGSVLFRCSIYMIFNKLFWAKVLNIQTQRINWNLSGGTKLLLVAKLTFLPFYIIFCVMEALLCVLFYGVPLFGFVVIMVKGATSSLASLRKGNRFFSHPIVAIIGTIVIFAMFLFFAYSVCLIFIESFSFLSQIIIFCFVAVIIYPTVSFGYLFFFIVLLYYLVRLVRDFGDGYLELLSTAVERSQEINCQLPNRVTIADGVINIANVQAASVVGVKINGRLIELPHNFMHNAITDNEVEKYRKKDNMYGIPKKLFEYLIVKHRPVHQQVIQIVFRLTLIVLLIIMTMSITSTYVAAPTTEISEVMHVIFIVSIGALPRVLEVVMMNSSEMVRREVELRHLEQSIAEYWQHEVADETIGNKSERCIYYH